MDRYIYRPKQEKGTYLFPKTSFTFHTVHNMGSIWISKMFLNVPEIKVLSSLFVRFYLKLFWYWQILICKNKFIYEESVSGADTYHYLKKLNRWSRRKRGMAYTQIFIIPELFLNFPNELSYGYLRFEGNGKILLGR